MHESFKISAPGKLFVLGEHAVVYDRKALVTAVNQRLACQFMPRKDNKVIIDSALGNYQASLPSLLPDKRFRFILAAIERFGSRLGHGVNLEISSDFDDKVGLGSSAAITAVMIAGMGALLGEHFTPSELFSHGYEVIQKVQGKGSGADLAASIYGGTLVYQKNPVSIRQLSHKLPLTVVYSGYKTPTSRVIENVAQRRSQFPAFYDSIFDLIQLGVEKAAVAIKAGDMQTTGDLFNINQGLLDALGVNDENLSGIVYQLRGDKGIYGAKISGSGLGDCIIGLGIASSSCPIRRLAIETSEKGLIFE